MKAIRIYKFGGPEVLISDEVKRPVPAANEILIKVYAAGINPMDLGVRAGGAAERIPMPFPITLGWDTAGIVEEVGSNVTSLKKGDEVYGTPEFPGNGSYAEFIIGKENRFTLKPESINFNEAATIPITAITAWQGIFENGILQSGQKILIHGASGGVGSMAVQLAKWKNAYVIGTASADNLDLVRQLGADEVIDYKNQKFDDLLQDIDLVFDAAAAGNDTQLRSVKVLKENGILVSTQVVPYSEEVMQALAKKNAVGKVFFGATNREWLNEIAKLIDGGKIKVTVSKVFPLENAADAHREIESKQIRGKVVLQVRKED